MLSFAFVAEQRILNFSCCSFLIGNGPFLFRHRPDCVRFFSSAGMTVCYYILVSCRKRGEECLLFISTAVLLVPKQETIGGDGHYTMPFNRNCTTVSTTPPLPSRASAPESIFCTDSASVILRSLTLITASCVPVTHLRLFITHTSHLKPTCFDVSVTSSLSYLSTSTMETIP